MELNGTAFAGWASRFADYAEGQSPSVLVPVAGGASVPFVHSERKVDLEETEAGGLDVNLLVVMVRQRLETAAQYTHDGETWTVRSCDPDKMAGVGWPYRAVLVGHAR